jgi:SAM-dependent methyltransferase
MEREGAGMNAYTDVRPIVGGSLQPGKAYHDIPGLEGPTYRSGSQQRADQIAAAIDVKGKRGIDLGCSVGGVSFGLATHGAYMTGIDYDTSSISVAEQVALERSATCAFGVADLTEDHVWDWITAGQYDFAVWLSNWMWLARQAGHDVARRRLQQLSESVPVLVFETSQGPGDGMAGSPLVVGPEGVKTLLETSTAYTTVEPAGKGPAWCGNRTVFVCR